MKKHIGQMSTGTYKQSITIVTRLVTLQSFTRKKDLLRLALNDLLYIHKVYFISLHPENQ